jgi:hypothetical protein
MMDSAEHCRAQLEVCRRLESLSPGVTEANVLKSLTRSWVMIANQIDRYEEIMRLKSRGLRNAAAVVGL